MTICSGRRVGYDVSVIACGRFFYYQHGYRDMCLNRRTVCYEYDRGFTEYMLVTREAMELVNLVKMPTGVSVEEAALTEPLAYCINGLIQPKRNVSSVNPTAALHEVS